MTITQDPSACLVAVVGATGNQGGSVVNGLEESDKPYRVRAFTRDATKPAAQALVKRGVEVVTVSLVVENKEEVYKAFAGADVAFVGVFRCIPSLHPHDENAARYQLLGPWNHGEGGFFPCPYQSS